MNRRSFLATLCAVVVAPLVAVAAPKATAATRTLSLHGQFPALSVGTLLSIENGPYSEVLRIVAVCGDGVFTVERG